MDRPSSHEPLRAPSHSGHAAQAYAPGAGRVSTPRLDDHLVRPEVTRDEVVRGERMVAMPSRPEHGDRHFRIDYVLGGHVSPGYTGSTDLLTRFGQKSDFATDTCIRRTGKDPATGDRYLEEVAFEVVHTQSMADLRARAEDLTARGVRRFFAILVKKGEVAEWSGKSGRFLTLDAAGEIADPTRATPVRVRALLDAAEADNGVARALLSKKNPVLEAVQEEKREEGREEGREQGALDAMANAVLAVLEARKLSPSEDVRRTIAECKSTRTLDRWLRKAVTAKTAEEIVQRRRKR